MLNKWSCKYTAATLLFYSYLKLNNDYFIWFISFYLYLKLNVDATLKTVKY